MNKLFVKKNTVLPVVLLLLVMTGCSTVQFGRDFDVVAFESVAKVGETTKAQVQNLLGSPKSTGVAIEAGGEQLVEWGYFFGTGKLPGLKDAKLKSLQIRFDQAGKVRSYNWSDSK